MDSNLRFYLNNCTDENELRLINSIVVRRINILNALSRTQKAEQTINKDTTILEIKQ